MSYGGNDDSYGSSRNEDRYGSGNNDSYGSGNNDSYGSGNNDSYGSRNNDSYGSRDYDGDGYGRFRNDDNDDSYGSRSGTKNTRLGGGSTSSNLAGADSLSYNASDNDGRTYDNDPSSYGENDSYGSSNRRSNNNNDSYGDDNDRTYGSTGRNDDSYGSSGRVGGNENDSYGSSYGGRENDSYGSGGGKGDSKVGKFLEKAGGVLHSDKLESKGHAKRENKGYGNDSDY
ncbi:stress protein ddr48 [Colletotrichum plurivorum]|uniref:Stress protein ddr48 n=1 Tax=Colletotrichum plurivorum TaxID=2175906 RepID=A0A8H6KUS2_9PEZI|nr:stress protein ddr48 [Colletotrichum plurivorum]